jgi:hypothetical protein
MAVCLGAFLVHGCGPRRVKLGCFRQAEDCTSATYPAFGGGALQLRLDSQSNHGRSQCAALDMCRHEIDVRRVDSTHRKGSQPDCVRTLGRRCKSEAAGRLRERKQVQGPLCVDSTHTHSVSLPTPRALPKQLHTTCDCNEIHSCPVRASSRKTRPSMTGS